MSDSRLTRIATAGSRNDMTLFAHDEDRKHDEPLGQIVIRRAAQGGWIRQIPLQGKMSADVVINGETLRKRGSSPDEFALG